MPPRRRMIDPAIWQSYTIAQLTPRQRLLFVGLFSNADDQGRLKGHPSVVRSLVFLYDDISLDEIDADLQAIAGVGSIVRYTVEDRPYIQITGWWTYQEPQWASPSRIAPPDGWQDRLRYRRNGKVHTNNWGSPGGFVDADISSPGDGEPESDASLPDVSSIALPEALPKALPKALPEALPKALPKALPEALPKALPKALPEAIVEYSIEENSLAVAEEDSSAPAAATATKPNAFTLFEQACGMLSPLIADEIKDRIAEFEKHRTGLPRGSPGADVDGDGWVGEAIREMARSGIDRPNVRYVTAILDRWKRDGYQFGNNDRKGSGHATSGRGGGKRNGPVEEVVCATGLGDLISEIEEGERARDGPGDDG